MKRIAAGLFIGLILLYNGGGMAESARAALLMEAATGRILYAEHAHEPLPMASTTKIMTALLALEKGNLQDQVTASANAFGVPGTSLYLEEGESLTLEEMLYGLMLASGNDAAVAIAEHIGGTVPAFCRMMTERAQQLGCENTLFATPHGLPAPAHHTTAYDLALITREAMKNPVFREIVSTERASIPWQNHPYSRVLHNKNKLLSSYPGAVGVKTGYTRAAGRCLVFAAERDGMLLIGVLLNCPDWFEEAEKLLNQGFQAWQMVTLLEKGEIIRTLPVSNGVRPSIPIYAGEGLAGPVPLHGWPDLKIELPDQIPGGIRAHEKVGTASLIDEGQIILSVPLLAGESVPEKSFRSCTGQLFSLWLCRP